MPLLPVTDPADARLADYVSLRDVSLRRSSGSARRMDDDTTATPDPTAPSRAGDASAADAPGHASDQHDGGPFADPAEGASTIQNPLDLVRVGALLQTLGLALGPGVFALVLAIGGYRSSTDGDVVQLASIVTQPTHGSAAISADIGETST